MEASNDESIESLLIELKWNNKEAIRLFTNERKYMLNNSTLQVLNSNSCRENLSWINSHMEEVEKNLSEFDDKFLKWKTLREAVERACTESVTLKSLQFDEMRRTASLYYSLGESISTQQSQEFQLRELTSKFTTLQKQATEVLQRKVEVQKSLVAIQKKHSELLKENEEHKLKKAKTVNTEFKRQGAIDVDGTHPSPTSSDPCEKAKDPSSNNHNRNFEASNGTSSSSNRKIITLVKKKRQNDDVKKDLVIRGNKFDDSKESLLGRTIRKNFPSHGYYDGTIQAFKRPYFTVIYDDGDKEEITMTEILLWLVPV